MPDDEVHYFAMMLDDQPYAVIRRQGGLLERWSPDRGEWKEALFHWDTFFGRGDAGEKRAISTREAEELIANGAGLRDIDDVSWAALTHLSST
ncbi:MAG: hypothetical protein NTX29_15140 [Actinobacteria bacterium]|nr:hypothetical protein [Actinomycetota bacterium]